MNRDWPPLLRLLHEKLDRRVRQTQPVFGYAYFYVDLSDWKLMLSDRTPFIWITRADLEGQSPEHLIESLQDVVRERGLRRHTLFVLLDGPGAPFKRYITSPLYDFVFLDSGAQEKILRSRRPTGALLDLISSQIPIANLAPYEVSSPVTGSRFFGREYEIKRILAKSDTNHAVLGIRRIGKTSLLQEIGRILENDANPVVYLDCSDLKTAEDYIREVVRKLNPKELPRLHLQKYIFFFPDFLERMAQKHKHKITFLLDEIDELLAAQRNDRSLIKMLRASANKDVCQYIYAGFREAMREQYDQNSPLYNFATPMELKEFNRQQAHDLIVTPMENLRVRFHNKSEIIGRIYEETAGHPNLIQYYCQVLLRQLERKDQRELSLSSLIDVYNDEEFRKHLLNSFMQNTQNREKIVVYTLLEEQTSPLRSFSQAYIDGRLKKAGIFLPHSDIDEACQVLKLAGIFHQQGREFSFTSPVFTKVLRQSYDIGYLLEKAKEEGI